MKRRKARKKRYGRNYDSPNIFAKKSRSSELTRKILYGLAIIGVLFVCLFLYFNIFASAGRVILKKDMTAEINTHIAASDFVEEIRDGHISSDQAVDTSSTGKKICRITVTFDGKRTREKEYEFQVTVVDTLPPEIGAGGSVTIFLGSDLDIVNQGRIRDNSGEVPKISVSGSYNAKKEGSYPITVTAQDASGNKTEKNITVNVIDGSETAGDISFTTGRGFTAERIDGVTYVDGHVFVNKNFSLPRDYEPGFSDDAYYAFYEMVDAAAEEEIYLWAFNDYISWESLDELYKEIKEDDPENADSYWAEAGHSDHQTGLSVDINEMSLSFSETAEFKWVKDHCWEHGFILRYPEGKEDFTGFGLIPWHLRYVGKDLAKELYNGGNWLSMEEYFGL